MNLSPQEREALFEEARELFGNKDNLSLEEDMAEGFREYVMSQENRSFGRKILDFFRNLFAKITNWKYVRPSLYAYYRVINQGKYIKSDLGVSSISRLRQEQYTPEMEDIKARAIADDTFMKAPNGNPTNLNERQWLQVRTRNFINWFGDWINNPSEASKVVDENGEPLVVYHESPEYFTIFDTSRKRFNVHRGTAAWFSTENREGQGYGEFIYPCFLNIRNLGENHWNENDEFESLRDKESRLLEDNNFDGIKIVTIDKFVEETQYAVHKANQIKSATSNNGNFSTINDDIRYRTIPNSSWSAVDSRTRQALEAKGWTQEQFDRISQIERDRAIECIAL